MRWIVLGVGIVGGCGPQPAVGPTAALGWEPSCDLVPDITFTDASIPGDAPIQTWSWGFGHDGAGATGSFADHRFPEAGTYDVSLTVTDSAGLADTITETLELWACLEIVSVQIVSVGPDVVRGSAEIANVSGYDDAAPSFRMDLLDDAGQIRFSDVDAGQHTIAMDETVTVDSFDVVCGAICEELVDLDVRVEWNGWLPPPER